MSDGLIFFAILLILRITSIKSTYNNSVRFWRKLNTSSDKAARSALDGADALRRTHCPTIQMPL